MIYLLIFISAIANSIMDRCSSQQEWEETFFGNWVEGRKKIWWAHVDLSSGLKWKRDEENRVIYPKKPNWYFPIEAVNSTNLWVWTTDAWHFFQMVWLRCRDIIVLSLIFFQDVPFVGFVLTSWHPFDFASLPVKILIEGVILLGMYGMTFEFFYAHVWTGMVAISWYKKKTTFKIK